MPEVDLGERAAATRRQAVVAAGVEEDQAGIVERAYQRQHVGGVMEGGVVGRFVEQSPNDDAGMIPVAPDQITYFSLTL